VEIKIDFIKDWHEILKDILTRHLGLSIENISNDDIPLFYFEFEKRRIEKKPRQIEISDSFQCPDEIQEGWAKIQNDFSKGNDLTPHLHKPIKNIRYKDLMLNDWRIHHFHLGHELESDSDFIQRTGPLLFGIVTDECLYAINVYNHNCWTKQEIIETAHRNWPDLIHEYRFYGRIAPDQVTDLQKKTLRNKHVNMLITVSDGTTYVPIGGGISMSGMNIQSTIKMDHQHIFLKDLEKNLIERIDSILPELKKQGYDGKTDIKVQLDITENSYWALFPQYSYFKKLYP
jgi:hypothetical protein